MIKGMLIVILLLAGTGRAMAAQPLVTDDTGTQGGGNSSLEISAAVSRDTENLGGIVTRENGGELALTLSTGLAESVDLVVGLPWVWSRLHENGALGSDNQGSGDLSLELKWRFYENGQLSMALKPAVTLPTGNYHRGLGNGKPSYGLTLIASRQLAPFTLHANAAYTHHEFRLDVDKQSNRQDIWHASVAGEAEVAKRVRLVADVGFESNGYRGAHTWPAYILGGIVWGVAENLDLDLGIKHGLNGPEADMTYCAGVAWRF